MNKPVKNPSWNYVTTDYFGIQNQNYVQFCRVKSFVVIEYLRLHFPRRSEKKTNCGGGVFVVSSKQCNAYVSSTACQLFWKTITSNLLTWYSLSIRYASYPSVHISKANLSEWHYFRSLFHKILCVRGRWTRFPLPINSREYGKWYTFVWHTIQHKLETCCENCRLVPDASPKYALGKCVCCCECQLKSFVLYRSTFTTFNPKIHSNPLLSMSLNVVCTFLFM